MEDLIAAEEVVVTMSHTGYIKYQPIADYRAEARRTRQAGHGDEGR